MRINERSFSVVKKRDIIHPEPPEHCDDCSRRITGVFYETAPGSHQSPRRRCTPCAMEGTADFRARKYINVAKFGRAIFKKTEG